jgi:DNA-binding NarL/FixJ family response regulator
VLMAALVERPEPKRPPLPDLLLLEPDYVLRRAFALTAASEQLAHVHETGSHHRVTALLARQRFDGFVIAINEVHDGLQWVEAIRTGRTRSDADAPIVELAERIDHALARRLHRYRVHSILLKPCRVRSLIDALQPLPHDTPVRPCQRAPHGAFLAPAAEPDAAAVLPA